MTDDDVTSGGTESLRDELAGLIADARVMATSEIAFQKARAGLAGAYLGKIAGFGALALVLAWFALLALTVGLLLALAPVLGAWGAMGAVVGGLLLATVLTALTAYAGWRRLNALFKDEG